MSQGPEALIATLHSWISKPDFRAPIRGGSGSSSRFVVSGILISGCSFRAHLNLFFNS